MDSYQYLGRWGTNGTSNGQFFNPNNISIDSSDNVYISDANNRRIQKLDSEGNFLAKWSSEGEGDGQFLYPFDITVDSSGSVYVSDIGNSGVHVFAPDISNPSNVGKDIVERNNVTSTPNNITSSKNIISSTLPTETTGNSKESNTTLSNTSNYTTNTNNDNETSTIPGNTIPDDGEESAPQLPSEITDQV